MQQYYHFNCDERVVVGAGVPEGGAGGGGGGEQAAGVGADAGVRDLPQPQADLALPAGAGRGGPGEQHLRVGGGAGPQQRGLRAAAEGRRAVAGEHEDLREHHQVPPGEEAAGRAEDPGQLLRQEQGAQVHPGLPRRRLHLPRPLRQQRRLLHDAEGRHHLLPRLPHQGHRHHRRPPQQPPPPAPRAQGRGAGGDPGVLRGGGDGDLHHPLGAHLVRPRLRQRQDHLPHLGLPPLHRHPRHPLLGRRHHPRHQGPTQARLPGVRPSLHPHLLSGGHQERVHRHRARYQGGPRPRGIHPRRTTPRLHRLRPRLGLPNQQLRTVDRYPQDGQGVQQGQGREAGSCAEGSVGVSGSAIIWRVLVPQAQQKNMMSENKEQNNNQQ